MTFIIILQVLWFILPAYAANGFPPIMHGKIPLDNNKKLGKMRVLGNGKTLEGTIGGILFGILIGIVQISIQDYIPDTFSLFHMNFALIFLLSIGALAGDILGTFIKRRFEIPQGEQAFLLDQIDFLVVAIIFAAFIYFPGILMTILLIVITPPIHLITNRLAYAIKIKKAPW